MVKKEKKEKESLPLRILKGLGKSLKNSHDTYVLAGLIAEATSEDKVTRLRAIVQLQKDFPEVYKEIKSELKKK